MFIFIDESGSTYAKSGQKYLIIAFAIMKTRNFAEELVFEIKDTCKSKGVPISKREIRFSTLSQLQKEICAKIMNSRYKNFYICFLDIEKSCVYAGEGKNELDIIMDKKLPPSFQKSIEESIRSVLRTNKGIHVRTVSSSSERGVQVADIIAGLFRAKIMKKSDLFEVNYDRVFQIILLDRGRYLGRRYVKE